MMLPSFISSERYILPGEKKKKQVYFCLLIFFFYFSEKRKYYRIMQNSPNFCCFMYEL